MYTNNDCSFFKLLQTPSSSDSAASVRELQYFPASLKLRDWLISRQRNWGTPIPAINCLDCHKSSIVDSKDLPVNSTSEQSRSCSHCGSKNVANETDTLDTFFDSSWYFFRFLDPRNDTKAFEHGALSPLPVHTYIGGKEHGMDIGHHTNVFRYFMRI